MKKVVLLVSLLTLFCWLSTSAQSDLAKNTVYGELAGKGFYYSLNYERTWIHIDDKIGLATSVGFCLVNGQTDIEKSRDFTLPLEINVNYGMGNHHIVAGFGTTYWRYFLPDIAITNTNLDQQPLRPELKKVTEWFAHGLIEYRFQKPEGGLMLKAGYVPLFFAKMENFAYQKKANYATSFNFGVGYSF